jgi:hypothetical protein
MMSFETLPDGKYQLNVYTENGIIHHVFDNMEEMEKYAERCLNGRPSQDYP